MDGKVYFNDGHTEDIIFHREFYDHEVCFFTESGWYFYQEYADTIGDTPYKVDKHVFYKAINDFTRELIPADISKIELYIGMES